MMAIQGWLIRDYLALLFGDEARQLVRRKTKLMRVENFVASGKASDKSRMTNIGGEGSMHLVMPIYAYIVVNGVPWFGNWELLRTLELGCSGDGLLRVRMSSLEDDVNVDKDDRDNEDRLLLLLNFCIFYFLFSFSFPLPFFSNLFWTKISK